MSPRNLIFFLPVFIFHLNARAQKKTNPRSGDTVRISITNLGKQVNTAFPEYAPVISADGQVMVFTSRRPLTEREIMMEKPGKENIYISQYDEKKKKWREAKMLGESVNEPGRHNSAIALSNDGQKMLLYRDDNAGNGDIYESRLYGESWSSPVKLPEPVNTRHHESSATFSPDGQSIYFVSNRKGGIGKRDIWMCRLDITGKWGVAENLGDVLNTYEDEEGVFLHPDGKTLYFSSKGHKGAGGFDIFKSIFENGKWSPPENMTMINTPEDDLYFVLAANGQTGFFSSAKSGGLGDKDIYEVHFVRKKKETGPQLTLLKGVVTDELSGAFVEASIEIVDNEKNKVINSITSNKATGKYLVSLPSGKNYGIVVKAKGYLFHSENVNIPFSAGYQEIIRDIKLKKIEIGKSIVLNNIFYDFDKATLRPESMSELERLTVLIKENPSLKIEISSHTDNKGSDEYNQKLSQERAQSVVDFLIGKGIPAERLVAKGYGESMLVSENETEEGRQLNRRTEFKILSL
jgi:outer membrane protein OmpA-like peptidoglycan-associated protein